MPNLLPPVFLAILLVFYLYALARWQIVKRAPLFFFGAAGLLFAFLGQFFALGDTVVGTVAEVFNIVGLLVAFTGAVLSCAGASVSIKGMIDAAKAAVPSDEE